MKERGSGLKTTYNEFMESVLETSKEMIIHNAWCTLLPWSSCKSVLKLGMLPRRYSDEMINRTVKLVLGREIFHQC